MIGYLTIDASLIHRMVVPNDAQTKILNLFSEWTQIGYTLCAPTLFSYEVTSSLTKLVRLGLLSESSGKASLKQALALDIDLFPPTPKLAQDAFLWTRKLNRVAAYDSFYLSLAQSLSCELWTADKKLVNAANVSWVKLVA